MVPLALTVAAGLVVAVLTVLEDRIRWLASFCGYFGEGCKKTESYTLFTIPVSWWGVAYYLLLAGLIGRAEPLVFLAVMAGSGFELTFLWILASRNIFCIFCLLNGVIMALLFFLTYDPERSWEAISMVLLFFMVSQYLLRRENRLGATSSTRDEVARPVAKVGQEAITVAEVERPISGRIYNLEKEIYRLKRKRLNEIIHNRLLSKEAERRGVPVETLIDWVLKGQPGSGDPEIRGYYSENAKGLNEWSGTQEELRARIREFLKERGMQHRLMEYVKSLKERHEVDVFLRKPWLPLTRVSVENSPTLGPSDAPVVVVEFSDYLCPACRAGHEVTARIRKSSEGKLWWVFKDFPLDMHRGAKEMAQAARCAGEQGKFWEYQDLMFSSDGRPDLDQLKSYARDLDLDVERFARSLESWKHLPFVEADIQGAREAGVVAVPTFIINGKKLVGAVSFEEFKRRIDECMSFGGTDHWGPAGPGVPDDPSS